MIYKFQSYVYPKKIKTEAQKCMFILIFIISFCIFMFVFNYYLFHKRQNMETTQKQTSR